MLFFIHHERERMDSGGAGNFSRASFGSHVFAMKIYVLIIIGRWKLENWHLYRRIDRAAVKHPNVTWQEWKLVMP